MNAKARRIALALIASALVILGAAAAPLTHPIEGADDDDLLGIDLGQRPAQRPTVQAAFQSESYRPGEVARLKLSSNAKNVMLQFFRAGTETEHVRGNDKMLGDPVSGTKRLGRVEPGETTRVRIGHWPTGFYYAQLQDSKGRIGYAPFVLRPSRLGEHRVAVVFPTQTWQAYNLRDDDHDGKPDTWYGNWRHHTAKLYRPFENRGTPRHYRNYEEPFLRWLIATHHDVDYLSDRELKQVRSGADLTRDYDLIIFEGHHEYVTTHEYDVVTDYRDRGGNLMFLAANNFFCRIDIDGDTMNRVDTWRNLGRPEAALVGVQYIGWNQLKYSGKPYVLGYPASLAWVFDGTGLKNGDNFASGGIEIDHRASSSPHGLRVLATIPEVFGKGMTAEMSYYETKSGAKVFAAGAFSLGGEIGNPQVAQLVSNVWTRLAQAS